MYPIYLDNQATTPCDPRVVEVMRPHIDTHFGNPHSRNHAYGWMAEEAVEKARAEVALSIGAEPKDIIFTSGATEANNLAIKGAAYFRKKGHLITAVTEHKCVLETMRALENDGFSVTYLPVDNHGMVHVAQIENALREDTFLVSLCAVNGEIGVIHPLAEIGALCRRHNIYFHTDAAQALGKIQLDVHAMNVDLMSLSGHKIYGPKGVGALYVRRKPRVRLQPLFHGGGQERGLRSGTLAPFLCVGMGMAAKLAAEERECEVARITALRDLFYQKITEGLQAISLNGDAQQRVPHNLNISFFGVEGEGLMMGLKNLAVSSGSACTSASLEPSYVLHALGIKEEMAHTSLRISFGRFTTVEEVIQAAEDIIQAVTRLRSLSPLWDFYIQGIDLGTIEWIAH